MFNFPSGEWVGFYTYSRSPRRFLMDLVLRFSGGVITGSGADGVAEFTITGVYFTTTGECSWTKKYVGKHSVHYQGYREAKGIWGTWTLMGIKGGFHIWPIGLGGGLDKRALKEDLDLDLADPLPVLVPQTTGSTH